VKRLASIMLLLASLGMAAPASCAQIVGKIADSQGTPISNVKVALTDAIGHTVRSALTDASGIFRLGGVNPGDYQIQLRPLTGGWLGNTLPVHLSPSGLTVRWKIMPETPSLVRVSASMPLG
jgi:hypothetical protein